MPRPFPRPSPCLRARVRPRAWACPSPAPLAALALEARRPGRFKLPLPGRGSPQRPGRLGDTHGATRKPKDAAGRGRLHGGGAGGQEGPAREPCRAGHLRPDRAVCGGEAAGRARGGRLRVEEDAEMI